MLAHELKIPFASSAGSGSHEVNHDRDDAYDNIYEIHQVVVFVINIKHINNRCL